VVIRVMHMLEQRRFHRRSYLGYADGDDRIRGHVRERTNQDLVSVDGSIRIYGLESPVIMGPLKTFHDFSRIDCYHGKPGRRARGPVWSVGNLS
jgi:hypothetical protein